MLQPRCATRVFDGDTIASAMISKHIMLTDSHGLHNKYKTATSVVAVALLSGTGGHSVCNNGC